MSGHATDVKKWLRGIKRSHGLVVTRTSNHYRLSTEDGKQIGIVPCTPSDGRWKKNLTADIRRRTGINLK